MKTLILNGSPRRNGDTVYLLHRLTEQLHGDYKLVDAYYAYISPCLDCRYCWEHDTCSIPDEMAEVYKYAQECDRIVVATPIYYSQPTGKLLDVCSRFQLFFSAARFRQKPFFIREKKGGVILTGGGNGSAEAAYQTVSSILRFINTKEVHPPVFCSGTDKRPASENEDAATALQGLIDFLNDESGKDK